MRERMIIHSETKVTVPAGVYVLGDPCYSMDRDGWNQVIETTKMFTLPVAQVSGCDILMFPTQYGDGLFNGPDGTLLGVDAGMIGLVPTRLPDIRASMGTTIILFNEPTLCERKEDGRLIFGPHVIHTGDDDGIN